MAGNTHKAEQPPKAFGENKQLAKWTSSNFAPNSSYSSYSTSSNAKKWSSPKDQWTFPGENNETIPSHKVESICLVRPNDTGHTNVDVWHTPNSQPGVQHTRDSHHPPFEYPGVVDDGVSERIYPPFSDQKARLDLSIGVNGKGASLSPAYANDPSPIKDRQQVLGNKAFSAYSHLQQESHPRTWTALTSEHPQTSLADYQLGIWAYNTINSEITFTERLVKVNWEVVCLGRL